MANSQQEVELAFLEKSQSFQLKSCYFRSKVGGKPPWLSLKYLPGNERLTCSCCGRICVFLLQIYCPIDGKQNCFHRSIYLFCCNNPRCYEKDVVGAVKIFRCQLPRKNPYYGYEPLDDSDFEISALPTAETYQQLCHVCGCVGAKRCGNCKLAYYCSKEHQVLDWKERHKMLCTATGDSFSGMPLIGAYYASVMVECCTIHSRSIVNISY